MLLQPDIRQTSKKENAKASKDAPQRSSPSRTCTGGNHGGHFATIGGYWHVKTITDAPTSPDSTLRFALGFVLIRQTVTSVTSLQDTGNSIRPMDKRQIQHLKTRLELRRHELRLSIGNQLQYARKTEPEPDVMDRATSAYEKESVLQRSNEEQQLLGMVESALRRFRDGSFGQCESCGKEIGVKRLAAVPWTRYCIQCQEDFER